MQIPLKTLLSSSTKSSGHFLAKSGICFKSQQNDTCVYGFGFSEIEENAKLGSQFEALERLYSNRAFHQNKENFLGYSLHMPNEFRTFSASEVLVSSILTFEEKSADANGLGCHPDIDQAKKHAILELIERHLLAEIWYGNGLISEVKEKVIREDSWQVRFYTSFCLDVPLAIAIVNNFEGSVWVLGSALRESFLQSMKHAKNEAFMLLESAFLENGVAYSVDVERRLASLKNKSYSNAREKFFQSKISNKNKELDTIKKRYKTEEIIEKALGGNPIWMVNLFKNDRLSVVRAVCDSAKNPRWLRGIGSEFIPLDPFC